MTDPLDTDTLRDMGDALAADGHPFGKRMLAAADEVDRLRHVRDAWKASTEQNWNKYQELRAVIENAPHGIPCASLGKYIGQPGSCTCWKADAL